MKKLWVVAALCVAAAGLAFAEGGAKEAAAGDERLRIEVGIDPILAVSRLIMGRVEYGLGNGGASVGARGYWFMMEVDGMNVGGFNASADFRFYPAADMKGFFLSAGAGYTGLSISNADDDFSFGMAPILVGAGHKWLAGEHVAIELRIAVGKNIPVSGNPPPVFGQFPMNMAWDGGLLVGWRF